jgi:alkylation response protein AidB-like acyl-CoA dehydrogenase
MTGPGPQKLPVATARQRIDDAAGSQKRRPMFDFGVGEELELLVRTVRGFAHDELAPRLRSAEAARALDAAVHEAYARIGLPGLELPIELGGAGLGLIERVLVNEELAAADAGAALGLDGLGPALYGLLELSDTSALAELSMALLEVPRARAVLITRRDAQLDIGEHDISGDVAWVPAARVDLLLLLDQEGVIAVREGIEVEPVPGAGLRAAGASALRLRNAKIVARVRDPLRAQRALARARLYVASLLVGVLRQACEYSRRYALERVAFGKPIAHHQALAFLITDMHAAVEGTRLLLHDAAWRAERALPCTGEAASAFVEAVEASRLVGPACVQILGGHGFMQDHPVEKYMREARALGLMLGGIDAAKEDAGAQLCESTLPIDLSCVEGA